jgi:hypothetical protein
VWRRRGTSGVAARESNDPGGVSGVLSNEIVCMHEMLQCNFRAHNIKIFCLKIFLVVPCEGLNGFSCIISDCIMILVIYVLNYTPTYFLLHEIVHITCLITSYSLQSEISVGDLV